ncbi:MAG TPA: TIGR03087 family PEP-CTERM/XrtA system glycosyltransferase [Phycisphaerae bacterium]|nr:TIGR03087 family PEP-CTERM/XrtA system glycosyltransferase [Phycisphaerae bacterium]
MKRLLFIAHRVPYPPDKGERVRAFHELKALSRHFRITLAALTHSDPDASTAPELQECCEKVITGSAGGNLGLLRGALSLCAGNSVTEGYFRDRGLLRTLLEESQREPFDLVFAYSSSTLPYALAVPAAARVMDLVDVDSAKWAAYAQSVWWPKRWLYRREACGVQALERRAVETCDAVLLVSEAEVAALRLTSGKVTAIGNGVDTDFFKPDGSVPQQATALVFTGTLDYRPNVEGVCGFVREVWPALKREVPELTFTIVGRDPTPEVLRLAGAPGITVTGTVKDVRPYLASASLAVVPLRIARGIQNKILEAMAMGRAVVASPQAIEGLDVNIGEEVLRAESPDEWVAAVRGLLSDGDRRERVGQAARKRVVSDYSWASRMMPLVSLCTDLAGASEPAQGAPRQTDRDAARLRHVGGRAEPLQGATP